MNLSPLKVLLIEDNPADARLIREYLAEVPSPKAALEWAEELSEGLEYLASTSVDVVLLDLSLSDTTGFETFAKVHARVPHLPIIVLTGLEDEALAVKTVQEGAQDYLLKGQVDGPLLMRSMRYALSRKWAEEVLREERNFAESLIETAQAIVLVLDPEGRILRFNPFMTETSGYALEEVQGKDWLTLLFEERQRQQIRDVFMEALNGSPAVSALTCLLAKSGREREIDWRARALKDSQGTILGVLFIGHDISKWKEVQERALQSERLAAVGQMVAGLAHESRNALQRSQSCLEMLALRLENQPDAIQLVARLQKAQEDLHRLYEGVRSYAAPINLRRQPCDLRHVFDEAWANLAPLRRGREIRLVENGSEGSRWLEVDPFCMKQVFRNIIENSLSACRDPVEIALHWSRGEINGREALCLALRDNGPGLSTEQRQKIFDPFFTTKAQGTGLGMSIAKRIVETHGGQILVGPNAQPGAEIRILLPTEKP